LRETVKPLADRRCRSNLAWTAAGLGYPELGHVSLAEIAEVRGRLGLAVERDVHFVAEKPLSAYAEDARINGRIIA
jgi:hypothetical protein